MSNQEPSIDARVFRAMALFSQYSKRNNKCINAFGWMIYQGSSSFHNGVDTGYGKECDCAVIKIPKDKFRKAYDTNRGLYVEIQGEKFTHEILYLRQINYDESAGTLRLYMGMSGLATEPHYHYSIKQRDQYVDPFPYLAAQLKGCDICEDKLTLKNNTPESQKYFEVAAYVSSTPRFPAVSGTNSSNPPPDPPGSRPGNPILNLTGVFPIKDLKSGLAQYITYNTNVMKQGYSRFKNDITRISSLYNINKAIMTAQIMIESGFNPNAVNTDFENDPDRATGILQQRGQFLQGTAQLVDLYGIKQKRPDLYQEFLNVFNTSYQSKYNTNIIKYQTTRDITNESREILRNMLSGNHILAFHVYGMFHFILQNLIFEDPRDAYFISVFYALSGNMYNGKQNLRNWVNKTNREFWKIYLPFKEKADKGKELAKTYNDNSKRNWGAEEQQHYLEKLFAEDGYLILAYRVISELDGSNPPNLKPVSGSVSGSSIVGEPVINIEDEKLMIGKPDSC